EIAACLSVRPRYEIARVVLTLAKSTIRMLQEIFESLESLGVSVRTTGCVFVLADPTQPDPKSELEFSPQAVGTVSDWKVERDWNPVKEPLQALLSKWR